ncbi:hypothetical protein BJF93_16775 [Xaviernesmea oryzae]|uniref:Omptin family outer membrane protease n=1 Tax=Xaviernesmea oryzae TaxID=464029 RepID=A0A1Q9ATM5_9HYPH|nr:omptin family outer membrane protease [Xaviernesmea oryzae]OLP58770.1 hypothetical protein BJF93_16775 [Xaviernesmea oryzae]
MQPAVTVTGELGIIDLRAGEFVYDGGDKLSQLNWHSRYALLTTFGAEAELDKDWTLTGRLRLGSEGDGHMVDYDWIGPFATDGSMSSWSDRSISPDTRLSHYVDVSLEASRRFASFGDTTLSGLGGLRYTDVKWDAYGGGYIYSGSGFRDSVGHFPEGQRGISYRQKIPVPYVGVESETKAGPVTLKARAGLGMSLGINDIDDHWARQLRFEDKMAPAPVAMLGLTADYALTERVSLSLSGDFETVARRRGSTDITDMKTGEQFFDSDTAGASFHSLSLSAGLKARF